MHAQWNFQRKTTLRAPSVEELFCSNLDSDEDRRLSESDCDESEESSVVIHNIPVNLDIYATSDGTESLPNNSNVCGRFATRNILLQSSCPTRFTKHVTKPILHNYVIQVKAAHASYVITTEFSKSASIFLEELSQIPTLKTTCGNCGRHKNFSRELTRAEDWLQ
ncbi:hypothetical protein TNCV_3290931 [Trichonephila clavipes]|nr:hypothetical protein TNCV_3290931 [Trichonephila clavipes]